MGKTTQGARRAPLTLDDGPVSMSSLPRDGLTVEIIPAETVLKGWADDLGLLGLRKLRFEGRIEPQGKTDWRLTARLGATVIQPCTVTLAPVTTRIEEPVARRYLADWEEPDTAVETEMPEDDTAEAIPTELNLGDVVLEALSLALPLYPRAEQDGFETVAVTEPGKAPMTDDEAKPFAGLASLRDQLAGGSKGGDGGD
ncbi:MAG: DUF177 domain-containing protein [Pseudomonadota bacterium]